MRKNSVRKWLHAVLDFLPLFVIPIFAIYTRNENYNSNIEVQVEQNKKLTYNQLIQNGNFTTTSFWSGVGTGTTGLSVQDNTLILNSNNTNGIIQAKTGKQSGHKYYVTYDIKTSINGKTRVLWTGNGEDWLIGINSIDISANTWYTIDGIYTMNNTSTSGGSVYFYFNNVNISNVTAYYKNIMLIDLTDIYGSGNEPTSLQFKQDFPNAYYDYTLSKEMIIPNSLVTYNDTDVGSQFVYTLYNATDKYFNCTNLFNLEQVWNWVQLNLFGGNAPLMVYVVWQVIVYEFFMDLIFLLYSVFMFVIDFATNTLERFYRRSC